MVLEIGIWSVIAIDTVKVVDALAIILSLHNLRVSKDSNIENLINDPLLQSSVFSDVFKTKLFISIRVGN